MTVDLIKEYGDVIHDASYITDNKLDIISVSPKLDIALGGGVPEGSVFVMTGPEKIGKTVTALTFCRNAQQNSDRKVYYGNVENRLKPRDINGIVGLSQDRKDFQVISSGEGNILSAEGYLSIFDKIIHTQQHTVCVVDSFSALSSEAELKGGLTDRQVMNVQQTIAKFCRKVAPALPINKSTVVGITHLMANVSSFGRGKSKVEKSGNALKYQTDVKLYATHAQPLMQNESQIGQTVHWKVETSAIGAPGQKVESHIKYGRGIWKEMELADLMIDFGIAAKAGSWIKLPNGEKIQGTNKLAHYLENNPEEYLEFEKQVFETVGLER